MIFNLQDLISRSSEMAGGRKDWDVSTVSFYANAAYMEVVGRARFRGMDAMAVQSTQTGENQYQLPADFDFEKVVRAEWRQNPSSSAPSTNSNTAVLMKKNQLQFEQMHWGSDQSISEPQFYSIYADSLQVWPTPTSAWSLVMHYNAKPMPLVESTDTMVIDDRWHMAVLFKTVALLEAARGDREAEQVANSRYAQYASGQPSSDALTQQARYGAAGSFPREYFGS